MLSSAFGCGTATSIHPEYQVSLGVLCLLCYAAVPRLRFSQ